MLHKSRKIVIALLAVCPLAGCATSAVQQGPPSTASRDATCATGTVSADCTGVVRSYSKQDIDRTGATTSADALRLMDPSVIIHQ